MSMTRSAEKMFMLPVGKAKALNIVVGAHVGSMEEQICFRFNYLSMAFLGHRKVLSDAWEKNLLKRTECVFRFCFCHDRLYFCVRMPLSTYCW